MVEDEGTCVTCGEPIQYHQEWDLDDPDALIDEGWEHVDLALDRNHVPYAA